VMPNLSMKYRLWLGRREAAGLVIVSSVYAGLRSWLALRRARSSFDSERFFLYHRLRSRATFNP
jgi:hypothetical protein